MMSMFKTLIKPVPTFKDRLVILVAQLKSRLVSNGVSFPDMTSATCVPSSATKIVMNISIRGTMFGNF